MSSFSIVKSSYLENTNNIIINGNLTVNGTVTNLDFSFSSFPSRLPFFIDSTSYNDSTQNKFAGGVLAPNGNIYCIPYSSNYILVINPLTNATTRIPISLTIGAKYIGAVCKPNGKIYCIPFNSDTIMIIDSNTNSVSTLYTINTSNYPTIGSNTEKWCCGVLYNDFI